MDYVFTRRMTSYVLKSRRMLVRGKLTPAALVVQAGRIVSVEENVSLPFPGLEVRDVGELVVLPGVVDCHAHLNEPGRTDWEGFATGTAAAAAGGITTLVDMPLNSIPATTTVTALEAKARAVSHQAHVDYGFWGGVVPGNASELAGLAAEGVVGFKCFLCPSGVDEFPAVSRGDLEAAMPLLARLGLPLIVHAELEDGDSPAPSAPRADRYASHLASRPRRFERRAIQLMIELCRRTGCAVHIVHLSNADALEDLRAARAEGLPFTAETCPHYLTFAAEEIPDGATAFKCAPPIREAENRERLWQGLKEGTLSLVVSDHSPCTPALKHPETGDFHAAWGGIASLQLSLSIVWSGARARGIPLEVVSQWMSRGPALLTGLSHKGALEPARDADFLVFAPEQTFTVEPERLQHRHKVTPYAGRALQGRVLETYLRGQRVWGDGAPPLTPPRGDRLRREPRP
jgi:allantoinase